MGVRMFCDGFAHKPAAAIMHLHCSILPGDFADEIVSFPPAALPDTARFTCSFRLIWSWCNILRSMISDLTMAVYCVSSICPHRCVRRCSSVGHRACRPGVNANSTCRSSARRSACTHISSSDSTLNSLNACSLLSVRLATLTPT